MDTLYVEIKIWKGEKRWSRWRLSKCWPFLVRKQQATLIHRTYASTWDSQQVDFSYDGGIQEEGLALWGYDWVPRWSPR